MSWIHPLSFADPAANPAIGGHGPISNGPCAHVPRPHAFGGHDPRIDRGEPAAPETYGISLVALAASGRLERSQVQGFSMCLAFFAFIVWQSRKRSRHISTSMRRAIINRDLPGGEYDPQRHHIDHIWPHARGGSNTKDNLRVIEKRRNLQKGAKRPRMRDMF